MLHRICLALATGFLGVLTACDPATETPQIPPLGEPLAITRPNPPLPTVQLWIGPRELKAEVAATDPHRMTGMMFRKSLPENSGMLFVFPVPHRAGFWMKNTSVPLSAAYIDPEGTILEIRDLQPFDTNSVVAVSDQVQFVLEVNQGWFQRNNISPGVVIRTDRGSLRDTFLRRR